MSSPTYGTDKTASEQLVGDVTGAFSLKPKRNNNIDYEPRPDLVRPVAGEKEALPAPQESVVASNPAWPESPEKRLARIRADATANQDKQGFEPEIAAGDPNAPASGGQLATGESLRALESGRDKASDPRIHAGEVKKRLAMSRQGSANQRRFLSEPPLAYRQPAADAPADQLGEDELDKERRLKKEAAKKSDKKWWDVF